MIQAAAAELNKLRVCGAARCVRAGHTQTPLPWNRGSLLVGAYVSQYLLSPHLFRLDAPRTDVPYWSSERHYLARRSAPDPGWNWAVPPEGGGSYLSLCSFSPGFSPNWFTTITPTVLAKAALVILSDCHQEALLHFNTYRA